MGIAKMFNVTPTQALYDISYINTMMYSSATPMIGDTSDEGDSDFNESLDACNPDNFKDFTDDEETVRI